MASTTATIILLSGYDARWFVDPREALEAARVSSPDLIIADVAMSGMTGIDLAIRLKEESPASKILSFSGQSATVSLLDAACGQGHDFEVLAKPIYPSDLVARIAFELGTG